MSIGYHATASRSKFVSDSVQQGRALLVIYLSKRKNILTILTTSQQERSPQQWGDQQIQPWSHDRGLNPRPHPYHGCALPTELSRHYLVFYHTRYIPASLTALVLDTLVLPAHPHLLFATSSIERARFTSGQPASYSIYNLAFCAILNAAIGEVMIRLYIILLESIDKWGYSWLQYILSIVRAISCR